MSRSYVVAVDPGVTTGVALWSPAMLKPETHQLDFDKFTEYIDAWAPFLGTIVVERYTITAETLRKSRQTASLELIGFLRYVALREVCVFVMQSPGDAKRFATDDKLRKANWRLPSTSDHANDALRHLMLHLVKERKMDVPR